MSNEHSAVDGALAILVNALNSSPERRGDGPGLVLMVQGLIISGKAIANWEWFEDVEQLCKDSWIASGRSDTGEHGWAEFFKLGKEGMLQGRAESQAVNDVIENLAQRYRDALVDVDRPTHIHLRDAKAFPSAGASPIPVGGTYWRGRLADVSGWSFGLLGEGPREGPADEPPRFFGATWQ